MAGILYRGLLGGASGGGGGGGGFPTANLAVWYKADVGVTKDGSNLVSQWDDQSGHGYNLVQPTSGRQPTWEASIKNGLPGIRFPTGRGLIAPSATPGVTDLHAALVVFTYPTATFTTQSIIVSNTIPGYGFDGQNGTAQWAFIPFNNGYGGVYRRNGVARAANETISPLNASHYIVGTTSTAMSIQDGVFGNWPLLYDNAWTGHLHEIAFWYTDLTSGQIADVESYVTGRWGSF